MIREMLSPENRDWIERAKECAEKYVAPHAAEWDRTAEYPWSAVEGLKKYDLFKVWIPKEYGGAGGGVLNLCLVVEELSKVCGGFGVLYAVNSLGSFPIILGGTEEQKREWLPKIAAGEKLIDEVSADKSRGPGDQRGFTFQGRFHGGKNFTAAAYKRARGLQDQVLVPAAAAFHAGRALDFYAPERLVEVGRPEAWHCLPWSCIECALLRPNGEHGPKRFILCVRWLRQIKHRTW